MFLWILYLSKIRTWYWFYVAYVVYPTIDGKEKKGVYDHKTHKIQYFLTKFWESRDYDHSEHIKATECHNEV